MVDIQRSNEQQFYNDPGGGDGGSGGGSGGNNTLDPIDDSPGGPTGQELQIQELEDQDPGGGDSSTTQNYEEHQAADFKETMAQASQDGGQGSAAKTGFNFGTGGVLLALVFIFVIFNWYMKK